MQVHRDLGPGFLESVYHHCLAMRMKEAHVPFEHEKILTVEYLGQEVGLFRADFVCYGNIIIEIKAQNGLGRGDVAQLANYLSVTKQPLGLLLNFGTSTLEFRRVIGRHAQPTWPEDHPTEHGPAA